MKAPKSLKEVVNDLLARHGEIGKGCFRQDGNKIFCKVCKKLLSAHKKDKLESHIKTDLHKSNANRIHQSQIIQYNITPESPAQKEFTDDLVRMLLEADIPIFKLQNVSFKSFLSKYAPAYACPSRTVASERISKIYKEVLSEIQTKFEGKKVWLSIDETTDFCGRHVVNVIGRVMDSNIPSKYLINKLSTKLFGK